MFLLITSILVPILLTFAYVIDRAEHELAQQQTVVKHEPKLVQSVGVAYIMPRTPLKLVERVQNSPLKEVIPDKRKQYREWKENLQTYEQLRLKLYTN